MILNSKWRNDGFCCLRKPKTTKSITICVSWHPLSQFYHIHFGINFVARKLTLCGLCVVRNSNEYLQDEAKNLSIEWKTVHDQPWWPLQSQCPQLPCTLYAQPHQLLLVSWMHQLSNFSMSLRTPLLLPEYPGLSNIIHYLTSTSFLKLDLQVTFPVKSSLPPLDYYTTDTFLLGCHGT